MIYKLTFLKSAKKEWEKLSSEIRNQLKTKLKQRINDPVVIKDKLSSMKDCYKIKLRSSGYRLVYKVFKDRVVIQVVVVGKRSHGDVYKAAHYRL